MLLTLNRYQYPRHSPTSLGAAFQILLEKAHRFNYGALPGFPTGTSLGLKHLSTGSHTLETRVAL
jgi:hypothetical protein